MTELSGGPGFAQEDMSLVTRLSNVLIDPGRCFAAVVGRENAYDWLLPVLLACVVGLVAHHLTLDLVTDLEAPQVKERMAQMSEEQREQYVQSMEMMRTHGWMSVPVGMFSSLVLVGAVALFFTRALFDKDISYRQMLVVKAHASLALIPEWIVRTPLMLTKGSAEVHLGPGAFVQPDMVDTFFGRLLIGINLFDLWQVWVMGVGIAVMARAPAKKAIGGLAILLLLWIVVGAGIESWVPQPPPGGEAPAP